MAVTDWIQTAAVIYFAWQQNRIFKQQNQIFADQAGHTAMSKTAQTPWITRYWPTAVMVGLMGLTGYDIYARHGAPPAVPWWFYVLLLLVFVIVGLVIGRFTMTKTQQSEQQLIGLESTIKPVKVDLVPWKGKGDKMFLIVTNRGTEQQAFQGQCRIIARRNDPNTTQLMAFDLQWEYGGQSYTLLPGQSGNLLIASADHDGKHEFQWLQLETAVGHTKPQGSHWNQGDKLPEYDVEIALLGTKSTEPHREKFTIRAGTDCAIEMDKLGAALTEAPVEKPKKPPQLTPFIYTNVISLSVDDKKVSRGKNIKIRYVIESSEDASDKIWLGASVLTDKKTGDYFSNTDQDKYISLVKGRHEYDRDLRIPMNAPLGVHLLRANLWHVIAEGKSMIIARGTPIDIEIVA